MAIDAEEPLSFLDEPSQSGEIEFAIREKPVSLQAKGGHKGVLQGRIQSMISGSAYLLTGDVQIDIEWLVHEKERYETSSSPDIDNIIKPMLDALCGPTGLIIDDCQVQSISCRWIDWTLPDHRVSFRIRYFPDEWVEKDGLLFVEFKGGMCFPLNSRLVASTTRQLLDTIETMLQMKQSMEVANEDYYSARTVLPIQRFFHRSRVTKFPVTEITDLRHKLAGTLSRIVTALGQRRK